MASPSALDAVRLRQETFYDGAEESRYEWLTSNPVIRSAEQRLLSRLEGLEGAPSILEVGCGEGANLTTLRSAGIPFRYTGFDCFPAKVAFCRKRQRDGRFLVADARHPFPFRDASYDRILIRDLLHHLAAPDRVRVLQESMRVLVPGGRLWVVEGNAGNLLGLGFALLFPHERCMLETRAPRLQRLVAEAFPGHDVTEAMEEASNAFRLVYHYRFGLPSLSRIAGMRWLTREWDRVSRAFRPAARWAYSIVSVRKPHGESAAAGGGAR